MDEIENRGKRVSTKSRNKKDTLKFLSNFKEKLKAKNKVKFITLKQFKVEYLDLVKSTLSKVYYKNVEFSFKLLTDKFRDDTALRKISSHQVEILLTDRFHKANYATNLALQVLKSAFKKAVEWNYLNENPISRIKLPKIVKPFPVFISEIELKQIIDNEQREDFKDIYLFGFRTGCRKSGIPNIKWNAVDFANRIRR